jgi:hypothetical protein
MQRPTSAEVRRAARALVLGVLLGALIARWSRRPG